MTVIDNSFDQPEEVQSRTARRSRRGEEAVPNGWASQFGAAGLQNLRSRVQLQDFWTLSKAQTAITWIMIAMLIGMAAVFLLVQASAVAAVGREIQTLQYELNTIRQVNSDLERQIAETQSITQMRSRASQIGFHQAQPADTIYLVVPSYPPEPAPFVPFPETEAERLINQPEAVETMQEAIQLSLYQTVSGFFEGSAD